MQRLLSVFRRLAPVLLVAGGGAACGSSLSFETECCDASAPDGGSTGDCRDPSAGCFAPYVCAAADAGADDGGEKYACRDPRAAPTCQSVPASQLVPLAKADGPATVHWVLEGGCIPVSYEATLADLRDRLAQAMQAWSNVPCSDLCLDGPVAEEAPPNLARRERRIHVRSVPTSDGPLGTAQVFFDQRTGRVLYATIDLTDDATIRDGMTADDLMSFLGKTMGLARPLSPNVQSVLNLTYTPGVNTYDAPTAADVDAFCRLYGTPSLCGE